MCEIKWGEKRNSERLFCSTDCSYSFHKKENHPRWIKDRSKLKTPNKSIRESLEMKEWRRAVFARDNWTCRLCGNRSCKGNSVVLNAHHVKRLSDHPELGTNLDNGVTLCECCHKKTYGKEELYEEKWV